MHNHSSRSYIMVAGNMGMGLCAFSQVSRVHMSFTSDDSICDKKMNHRIMDSTTKLILDEIEKMKKEKELDQGGSAASTATNDAKSDAKPEIKTNGISEGSVIQQTYSETNKDT